MEKITMTLEGVCKRLRAAGMPMEKGRLARDIQNGTYPFGRVTNVSPRGRRTFEIFASDVEAFIQSKTIKG